MTERTRPVVLLGSIPREGPRTLDALGIPYHLLVDPGEPAPETFPSMRRTARIPYKSDPSAVLRIAPALGQVASVVSFTELGLLPAAMAAEALGLPTVPVAAVVRSRHKLLMRHLLRGVVDQPAFGVVGELAPTADQLPVVAKPVDGSGSRNVEYLETLDDYHNRSGDLDGFLWEQFVAGTEYSVETVSWPGQRHQIVGITEKITTGAPYFVEAGHRVPARLGSAQEAAIRRMIPVVLDGLGIDRGAAHTEVMVAGCTPVLIETHTRPGGDRIPFLHRLVSGLDQYHLAVQSILGRPGIPAAEPRFACAAVRYFNWQPGTVEAVDGLEKAAATRGLVELEVTARPGGTVAEWRYSNDRPGYCVVGGDSAEDVGRLLDDVQSQLSVTYAGPAGLP